MFDNLTLSDPARSTSWRVDERTLPLAWPPSSTSHSLALVVLRRLTAAHAPRLSMINRKMVCERDERTFASGAYVAVCPASRHEGEDLGGETTTSLSPRTTTPRFLSSRMRMLVEDGKQV